MLKVLNFLKAHDVKLGKLDQVCVISIYRVVFSAYNYSQLLSGNASNTTRARLVVVVN
jgi:hypothetical protein